MTPLDPTQQYQHQHTTETAAPTPHCLPRSVVLHSAPVLAQVLRRHQSITQERHATAEGVLVPTTAIPTSHAKCRAPMR